MLRHRPICLFALAGAIVGCSLPAEDPPQSGKTHPVNPEILAELKPWHPFKPEWAAEATVIIKATYSRKGPCIFKADGSIAMPATDTFRRDKAFKGEVACAWFEVGLPAADGQRIPRLVERRSYLLFLKPREPSLALLKNPKAEFTWDSELGPSELVAVVDLSQTQEEAETLQVQATEKGTLDGFTFTPEKWRALRQAKAIDLAAQKQFQSFIEKVVAVPGASLRRVRSYLGPPDYDSWHDSGVSCDYYFQPAAQPREGDLAAVLRLRFSSDLKLERCAINYMKHEDGSWVSDQ